jgi:hypothetical protein
MISHFRRPAAMTRRLITPPTDAADCRHFTLAPPFAMMPHYFAMPCHFIISLR